MDLSQHDVDSLIQEKDPQVKRFAQEHKFSYPEVSTFLSLVKEVFCICTKPPLPTIPDSYLIFETKLLKHCIHRPPFSIAVFDMSHVQIVCDFLIDSFFKHLKHYQLLFVPKTEETMEPADPIVIETPQLSEDNQQPNIDTQADIQTKIETKDEVDGPTESDTVVVPVEEKEATVSLQTLDTSLPQEVETVTPLSSLQQLINIREQQTKDRSILKELLQTRREKDKKKGGKPPAKKK